MALKSVLENLEGISEELKNEYVKDEETGNYYLSVDGMERSENYTGLKTSYANIKEEKKALSNLMSKYKSYGSVEEIEAMRAENEKFKKSPSSQESDKIANEKFEALRAQLAKSHMEEIADLKATISSQELSYRKSEMQHAAMKAINEVDASNKLAAPYLSGVMSIDEEGKVFIKGEDGLPLYDKTGTGYVSIKDHLESLKTIDGYKGMFNGSKADGVGISSVANSQGVIEISRSDPNFNELLAKHALDIKNKKAVIVS